ncbi:hypothetical protein [Pseudomonas sp. UBA1879]|uniref:hypothetical protein n=1 Tax=Pseudomonas sp. UBA1879 TaxID=1947305 RepID=UPI0025E14DEB|nr:hypothetical protein [Pseudomonas sp. UBA1879]
MTENRERVFRIALVAGLQAAVSQGLNIDSLAEAAIELLLNDAAYTPEEAAQAVIAVESAADAAV